MTQQEFVKALMYLKMKYPKWDFDVKDAFMVSVWYEDFEKMSYDSMMALCRDYSRGNMFPPNSPFALLDTMPKTFSVDEAWQNVLDVYSRNKTQEFFMADLHKEFPSLCGFLRGLNLYEADADTEGNRCLGYSVGRVFKARYRDYLKGNIYSADKLTFTDRKMLGMTGGELQCL